VETAFLLLEAADALGMPGDLATQRVARRLVTHALSWGWNAQTGQLYERGFALGPAFDRSIEWWGQFELVNALSLMDSLHGTRTPLYRDALEKAWSFTRDSLTDTAHGGVYQSVDAEGRVNPAKSHDWMATYHTARALLLTSERLRREARSPVSRPATLDAAALRRARRHLASGRRRKADPGAHGGGRLDAAVAPPASRETTP